MIVQIGSGNVKVPADPSCLGVTVTDVKDDVVIGIKSDPTTPPHLVFARYPRNYFIYIQFRFDCEE